LFSVSPDTVPLSLPKDNAMPRVSIITPTGNRQDLLPALWDCVRNQSVHEFEWLVFDASPQDAQFEGMDDRRIHYRRVPEWMTIGAKRNALCDAANADIIAHFDDDDFYGPRYLEGMLSLMTDLHLEFVKLFGFFLYHRNQKHFAYWDLERDLPMCCRLHPNEDLVWGKRPPSGVFDRWGYGFSYVFNRRVWEEIRFPNENHGEDQPFAKTAVARFRAAGKQDFDCSCVHVIHEWNATQRGNISFCYPQQLLPIEWLPRLFPHFPL
jgi:glycosyltransferase involved in cell wall biosynthesis